MKISICFSTNEKYFKYLCVLITSILKTSKEEDEFEFYILNSKSISQESKNNLLKLKTIKNFDDFYIDIDETIINNITRKIGKSFPPEIYFRLFISSLLPVTINKIIYLDVDTLVCESLSTLFSTDIADFYVAGVKDIGYYDNSVCLYRDDINFRYINSGVLLINLEKFRKDGIESKFLSFFYDPIIKLVFYDQDVINYVLRNKCKVLDLKYNVQDTFYNIAKGVRLHPEKNKIKDALNHPVVVHFTGSQKPWKFNYSSYTKKWFEYLQYTPYKENKKNIHKIKFFINGIVFHLKLYFRILLSPICILYRDMNGQLVVVLFKREKFKFF